MKMLEKKVSRDCYSNKIQQWLLSVQIHELFTTYNVDFATYCIKCTVYSAQGTQYSVQCTMYNTAQVCAVYCIVVHVQQCKHCLVPIITDSPHSFHQRGVKFYTVVLFSATQNIKDSCRTVQYILVQCSSVQCSAIQCSAVQSRAVQCSAVQCSAVQYSAVFSVQCQFSAVKGLTRRLKLWVVELIKGQTLDCMLYTVL